MGPVADRPMVLWGGGGSELRKVNRRFTEQLGIDEAKLAARSLLEWIHPDDRDSFALRLTSGAGRVSARHHTATGDWVEFEWEVRIDVDDTVVLGRLHSESAHLASPLPVTTRDPGQRPLTRTLEATALLVEARNPGLRCSILLVDASREHVTVGAGPSFPAAYNAVVEGLRIGPTVGSCGTAAYWNVPVIVEDIAQDPLWVDLREAAALAGVAACWSYPISSTDGDVLGAVALYSDSPAAPERHHLDGLEIAALMVGLAIEHEVLEQQLHETAKDEAIALLAGGMAHDFNNLMTVVLGNAELAQVILPPDSEAQPMLETIVTASLNAGELCDQMLAYSGHGPSLIETVECNELARDLGQLLQVAISKKAQLDFDLTDDTLSVQADRSQLSQVIMNLVTNASEAIGEHSGRLLIGSCRRDLSSDEVRSRFQGSGLDPGPYVQLSVTDTGAGMSTETQRRIFDPFFTTKPTGRGLGLALVRGIVHAHGGAVELHSAPGAGTTVSVLLPRVPSLFNDEQQPPPEKDASTACILVVDDEPLVRSTIAETLEGAGYTVVTARDGQEAVDVYRRLHTTIDLVLLDLNMPQLNGQEAFDEMRRIRSDVVAILSSGFTEQHLLDRFQGTGLAGVVHKPARARELIDAVNQALNS